MTNSIVGLGLFVGPPSTRIALVGSGVGRSVIGDLVGISVGDGVGGRDGESVGGIMGDLDGVSVGGGEIVGRKDHGGIRERVREKERY